MVPIFFNSSNGIFQIPVIVLLAFHVSSIKTDAESLPGTLGGPLSGSGIYKDGPYDYLQTLHHGQHHTLTAGSESGPTGSTVGGHSILNPQIQDQNSVISQDQISSHSTIGGGQINTPYADGTVIPQVGVSYFQQKSELPFHFGAGARAIGNEKFGCVSPD